MSVFSCDLVLSIPPQFSYQRGGVLVRPEGLRDRPVADGDTGFRVGSYIDQLVTAMPRLWTGLQCLSWSVWTDTYSTEEADFTGKTTIRS